MRSQVEWCTHQTLFGLDLITMHIANRLTDEAAVRRLEAFMRTAPKPHVSVAACGDAIRSAASAGDNFGQPVAQQGSARPDPGAAA